MTHVSLPVPLLLTLILLNTVLARQGMFLIDSESTPIISIPAAKPVEELGGASKYSYQAKPPPSAGFGSEPSHPHESLNTHKRLDAKMLLEEAAEEMVKLLDKDYFHKPSGKPPIHNR